MLAFTRCVTCTSNAPCKGHYADLLAASLQQTTRHQYPKEGVSTFEVEAVTGQLEGVERPHRTLSVNPVSCCLQFQTGIG